MQRDPPDGALYAGDPEPAMRGLGPSPGLGEDLRLDGGEVAGCALTCGGLVHATVFPRE